MRVSRYVCHICLQLKQYVFIKSETKELLPATLIPLRRLPTQQFSKFTFTFTNSFDCRNIKAFHVDIQLLLERRKWKSLEGKIQQRSSYLHCFPASAYVSNFVLGSDHKLISIRNFLQDINYKTAFTFRLNVHLNNESCLILCKRSPVRQRTDHSTLGSNFNFFHPLATS